MSESKRTAVKLSAIRLKSLFFINSSILVLDKRSHSSVPQHDSNVFIFYDPIRLKNIFRPARFGREPEYLYILKNTVVGIFSDIKIIFLSRRRIRRSRYDYRPVLDFRNRPV